MRANPEGLGTATIAEELLPDGSVGTPNERFIQEVYRDLLHRAVDPSALYWSSLLDQGQSRAAVVSQIIAAAMPGELGADLVTGIYQKYLGREPDAGGLAYRVGAMNQGASIEQVEGDVAGTQEFFALAGGTNAGFLDRLYQLALSRAPDPQGMSGFGADLASGMTREQVAAIVFSSHEFHEDEVAGWYQSSVDADDRQNAGVPFINDLDFLDRPADPGGLASYAAALDSGVSDQQIWASLMASDEFFAKVE